MGRYTVHDGQGGPACTYGEGREEAYTTGCTRAGHTRGSTPGHVMSLQGPVGLRRLFRPRYELGRREEALRPRYELGEGRRH